MHFTDPDVGLLGANAIVAAGIPHAAGAALAMQLQGSDQISVAFFGEGAVNQGVFHEALNLIAIWNLPVILICENNQYSEMTPSHETTSPVETWKRASSYGIESSSVDGNDVEAMAAAVSSAVLKARSGGGPTYLEAKTYRLWGHMMGDPEVYRSKAEVIQAWQNEPIARLGRRLQDLGLSKSTLDDLEKSAAFEIIQAVAFAQSSPMPDPSDAYTDVFL